MAWGSKATKEEISDLREMELQLLERLQGDLFVEYCENNEDITDVGPRMEIAADKARLNVLSAEIKRLEAIRTRRKK